MTVSSSTNRVSYAGNGSTTVFPYTYKIFDEDDLTVILRAANGVETTKTIVSDYTVSGVGNAGGGNVTMLTAPASGETLVVLREQDLIQELDIVPNDPFPADSLEGALDKLTFMVQQHEETLGRTIKASRTNTITGSEFTILAADRANKVFAFDSSGDVSIAQELGTYRGNWAASTAFAERDIVKDTSNNNIYICLTAHTSSGAQPISSNADVAKWALLVDAASATTSALAAASSATDAEDAQTAAEAAQTAAEAAQTAAELAETNAETAETNAEAAQTAAEAAQAAAELVYDNFDDRYLGAKATDPTLDNDGDALIDGALYFDTANNVMKVYDLGTTTWLRTTPTSGEQANIDTVSGIAANVTTVAGISADVVTVADSAANISTVATDIANVNTVAGISADVTTVAANVAGVTSFAEKYRVGTDDPAASLDEGDLFYNTTSNLLKVYNGSAWETGVTPGSGFLAASNNLSDLADASTGRINLGVAIGTDVLAFDTNLQAFVTAFTLPTTDGTAGQVVTTDGSGSLDFTSIAAPSAPFPIQSSRIFATSGSFTPPVTGEYVVYVVGGGGGGAAHRGVADGTATGGGAGGFAVKKLTLDSTVTYTVTVGSGGAALDILVGGTSTNGNAGGNSSLSGTGITTITANGGSGGTAGNTDQPGASGGSASGGDYNITGGGSGATFGNNTATGGGSVGWYGTGYSSGTATATGGATGAASGGAGVGGGSGDANNGATAGGGAAGPSSGSTEGIGFPELSYTNAANVPWALSPINAISAGGQNATNVGAGGGSGGRRGTSNIFAVSGGALAGGGGAVIASGTFSVGAGPGKLGGGGGGASNTGSDDTESGAGGDGFVLIQWRGV
jgi:hypothetical protein